MDRSIFEKILQKSFNEVKLILDLITNYDENDIKTVLETQGRGQKINDTDRELIYKKIGYLKGWDINANYHNNK